MTEAQQPRVAGVPDDAPAPQRRKTAWYKRKWLHLLGAGLVGLILGSAAGGGGSTTTAAQSAAKPAVDASAMASRVQDLENQLSDAKATASADEAKLAAQQSLLADVKKSQDAVRRREDAVAARESKVGKTEKVVQASTIAGDGTFLVGTDVKPGTYRAAPADSGNCYYARLSSLNGGDVNSIIDNGNSSGQVVVTIRSSDKAFTTNGCSEFKKIG